MVQPVKRFRCGACEVAIFDNIRTTKSGKTVNSRKATFQKRYKDSDGEWKSTNSLDINDIPKARLALSEAYKYLIFNKGNEEELSMINNQ